MSKNTEAELIEYAKVYLKAKGFTKKNKRRTKTDTDFTYIFISKITGTTKMRFSLDRVY